MPDVKRKTPILNRKKKKPLVECYCETPLIEFWSTNFLICNNVPIFAAIATAQVNQLL